MDRELRARLDRFWAAHLGCPEEWLREGAHVFGPEGQRGVYVVASDSALVVSAAPACAPDLERAARREPRRLLAPETLRSVLGDSLERLVGPAWIGYTLEPVRVPAGPAQRLDEPAAGELAELHSHVSDEEWAHAGPEGWTARVGLFSRGLVSAAGYQVQEGTVAHIGVVTRRAGRAAGCGRRVVSAIASRAVAAGLIPQYQTLDANAPALRVAAVLGFARYARTLAARLKEEEE